MHDVFHQHPASSRVISTVTLTVYKGFIVLGSHPPLFSHYRSLIRVGHILSTYRQGNKHRPDLHTVVNKVLTVTVDGAVQNDSNRCDHTRWMILRQKYWGGKLSWMEK